MKFQLELQRTQTKRQYPSSKLSETQTDFKGYVNFPA